MKISIGSEIIEGPFGGGNEYLKNLSEFLKIKGHEVVTHLKDKDIDIILLTSPFINSETSTFSNYDIDYYQKFINKNAISFHRINECDERKNTKNINSYIIRSNKNIDVTFFVSEWLMKLFTELNYFKNSFVVKGGPNSRIFNFENKKFWSHGEKVKIVTHHWSDNFMKGFEEYQALDDLLENTEFSNKYEFTYIGNIPKNVKFNNTNLMRPLHSTSLSNELKKHHIYITGSKHEPSGNHHMEGAMCGLPILYVESGGLPEYCKEYGLPFNKENLNESLDAIVKNYNFYIEKLKHYPYIFETSAEFLLEKFNHYLNEKENIISSRCNLNGYIVIYNRLKFNFKRKYIKIYYEFRKILGKVKSIFVTK